MRDHLCIEGKCKETIEYNIEFIQENREDIRSLKEDTKNGIQRNNKDNKSIIEASYLTNFIYEMENIRAKYSLGEDISSLEEDFHYAIYDLEQIGTKEVGYINLLWMISLGILLETDKKNIERLKKLVEKENIKDFVIDYLLCASDIGWTKITDHYEKEIPYSKTREIIELAQTDKREASKRMQTYMENEWFKGHYDYEWKNAHKEPWYVGFWSFETAALAKILELDDSNLKDNNHYPYDLAHYKNSMNFKHFNINEYLVMDIKEKEDWQEGIESNPLLEKIIPMRWHSFVDELIKDYEELKDERFYEQYKEPLELEQIWFSIDDYKEENKGKNLLGTLIVFALTDREYILQLDYKEDLEDYVDHIKNFWNDSETKLVQFVLNNDQNYYAWVPKEVNIRHMYEVNIEDVDGDECR
ncbi:PoNi-like cognate immunity protein [Metabacillus niabensis]|uniref:PoNi-like cognate immunity protein n=1 Tax=Metabacillus niabensis TaxID=324854 RepID=UPI0039A2A43A